MATYRQIRSPHAKAYAIPGLHYHLNGDTYRARAGHVMTGIWGIPAPSSTSDGRWFQAVRPQSLADADAGDICSRSGVYFPGHAISYINGEPVGKPFARPDPGERDITFNSNE